MPSPKVMPLLAAKAARNAATEQLDLANWLDDMFAEVIELRHMAHVLMVDIEGTLDIDRRLDKRPHGATVHLSHSVQGIEATTWLASRVWAQLAELDERISARINALPEAAS